MYKSTSIDTTERRIPWYYPAAILLLIAIIWLSFHMVNRVKEQLAGKVATVTATKATKEAAEHGAGATGEKADVQPPPRALRQTDYVAWMSPRIGGQPWTAPAYDHLEMPPQAPRLFCMAAGEPGDESCSCLTEQGTRYKVEQNRCLMIAKDGQYEPFRDEVEGERKRLDDTTQLRQLAEFRESHRSGNPQDNASAALAVTMTSADPTVAKYGDIARPTIAANADTSR